jgi:hypothetical protein
LFAGTSEQNIQSATSGLAVDGSEVLVNTGTRFSGAVDGRDVDDVTLVALDVLDVLYEEGL